MHKLPYALALLSSLPVFLLLILLCGNLSPGSISTGIFLFRIVLYRDTTLVGGLGTPAVVQVGLWNACTGDDITGNPGSLVGEITCRQGPASEANVALLLEAIHQAGSGLTAYRTPVPTMVQGGPVAGPVAGQVQGQVPRSVPGALQVSSYPAAAPMRLDKDDFEDDELALSRLSDEIDTLAALCILALLTVVFQTAASLLVALCFLPRSPHAHTAQAQAHAEAGHAPGHLHMPAMPHPHLPNRFQPQARAFVRRVSSARTFWTRVPFFLATATSTSLFVSVIIAHIALGCARDLVRPVEVEAGVTFFLLMWMSVAASGLAMVGWVWHRYRLTSRSMA